jgi:protoporphyrinogen/coproporphyrinogen III oxidase
VSRIAVIGGGITGLTAAFRLQQQGHAPTVFESDHRVGGKIRTSHVGGIVVEEGADAFLPRTEGPLALAKDVGIETFDKPNVFGAYIWRDGSLHKLPPGSPFGIPRVPKDARNAGLLSWRGALRAEREKYRRAPLTGPDISIGAFVRDRFGDEVLINIVDPLLAGVRGGNADEMSLAASAKEIDALARKYPSILRALRATEPETPAFVAPRGGLETLTEAIARQLDDVRTSTPVRRVSVGPGLRVASDEDDEAFDAVVIAVAPAVAADILSGSVATAAEALRRIRFASLAVVTLVYPPGSYTAPTDGSGFLVPSDSGLSISACTWYTEKWSGLTIDGRQVVRCVVGRAGTDPNLQRSDDELVALVHRDLQKTMGISAAPLSNRVTRWRDAIPQYGVGHLDLIRSIEAQLVDAGPVVLAGAGYRGSGIPDCIAQAEAAASGIGRQLPAAAG